ncbi:MAG TPA: tetratricopeptide repeat protein [Gemmatimonadales bacterium]|nr:tetratricopeptide repeat protein [Gemmatimonadales bacterium]
MDTSAPSCGGPVAIRLWHALRERASQAAARHARRLEQDGRAAAIRWLAWGAALAPSFGQVHRDLVAARRRAGDDRLGALALARKFVRRFEHAADAWITLGDALTAAFRPDDALAAYERALSLEERPDAAMAAGDLYSRAGDHATAGARYARAYAAGAGPDALRANARALRRAGDIEAAQRAVELWEKETGLRWADD